jgi:hypothetical protein
MAHNAIKAMWSTLVGTAKKPGKLGALWTIGDDVAEQKRLRNTANRYGTILARAYVLGEEVRSDLANSQWTPVYGADGVCVGAKGKAAEEAAAPVAGGDGPPSIEAALAGLAVAVEAFGGSKDGKNAEFAKALVALVTEHGFKLPE